MKSVLQICTKSIHESSLMQYVHKHRFRHIHSLSIRSAVMNTKRTQSDGDWNPPQNQYLVMRYACLVPPWRCLHLFICVLCTRIESRIVFTRAFIKAMPFYRMSFHGIFNSNFMDTFDETICYRQYLLSTITVKIIFDSGKKKKKICMLVQ